MTKRVRRRVSTEDKEQAVARLSEARVSCGSVAAEPGVTATQLTTLTLERDAAGSAAAIGAQSAEAAELARLRRNTRRLEEEMEGLRKGEPSAAPLVARTIGATWLSSTTSIPISTPDNLASTVDPSAKGCPDWTPIPPQTGASFHADPQSSTPFGTIRSWMGATHFQMGRLQNVAAEMALHVLA
ncbi:MAG: transposase [Pikeienuella sp.]